MKMLVLGAGLQGSAAAYNLLQHDGVEVVTLADLQADRPPRLLQSYQGRGLRLAALDAGDFEDTVGLMKGHDAALCALPYYFNEPMTRAAIESGCHLCDLGGNTEIVFQQKKHHDAAAAAGVSIVPDCGLAPGMVNILAAEGIRRLDRARAGGVFVGGRSQHPEPPLHYHIVSPLEGALDYSPPPSWVLRGGKAVQVDALSELKSQEFPEPVGTLEAFHTGGGIRTVPVRLGGKDAR